MRFLRANPGFRMVWAVNFVSSMVGWSMGIALSVHIYQLTESALWTATLAATPTVSGLLLGHMAGTIADRWNPLRLVQLTLLMRVVVLLGLFATSDSPIGLAILVFVQAALQQIYRPAEQVLIAEFVPADRLAQANGLNSLASNVTRLIAPAFGGFVIAVVGFEWTAIAMTGLMTCSALLSLLLGRWRDANPVHGDSPANGDGKSVGTFVGLLRRSPRLRGLVLLQVLDAVKEGPLTALFPVLMLGVVGATSTEMGLANSAFAVSAVVSGPVLGLIVNRFGYRLTIVSGAAAAFGLVVVLALWPSFPLAVIVFLLSGLPFTLSWVGGQTWMLLTAPRSMRGRVIGTSGAVYSGVTLVMMLGSGILAELVGAQWVIGATALVAFLGLIAVGFLLRPRAERDGSKEESETDSGGIE